MLLKTDKNKNITKIKKGHHKMKYELGFLKLPTEDKRILAIDEFLGE
jgi:hypothetical protein